MEFDENTFVSNVNKWDTLWVLLFGVTVGIVNEFVSWFFIYRKDDFKKKFTEVWDAYEFYVCSKVLPRSKSVYLTGESPAKLLLDKKKLVWPHRRNIQEKNTLSTVLTGLVLMGCMPAIMSIFEYSVVAKIPFKPFPILKMFTHSKLLGDDPTDCTATAAYTLTSMITREYMKVILGCDNPIGQIRESLLNEECKRDKKKSSS